MLIKQKDININDLDEKSSNYIIKSHIDSKINNKNTNNVILLDFEESDFALFTSSISDIIIYNYIIINNYSNVGLPLLNDDFTKDFVKCKDYKCKKNDICLNQEDIEMCNNMNHWIHNYSKYSCLYFIASIMWNNPLVYHIPDKLNEAILNVYNNSNKKRYIFLLNIGIQRHYNAHANIIILNLKNNYAVRFEPFGNINWDEMDEFDKIFEAYLKKDFKNIKYIKPSMYMPNLIFQAVSGEHSLYFKRHGDPSGYCLAWCLWFAESYINYEKKIAKKTDVVKALKIFLEKLYEKIIFNHPSFLDYIREYGNYLKKGQHRILKKINFPSNRLYSLDMTIYEEEFISTKINNMLSNLFLEP